MRPDLTVARVLRALSVLPEDERSTVMALFRQRGGDLDRWLPRDRAAMAAAMTLVEDHRETSRSRTQWPDELRAVRRRLESESDR